jgi:hypothetical protein
MIDWLQILMEACAGIFAIGGMWLWSCWRYCRWYHRTETAYRARVVAENLAWEAAVAQMRAEIEEPQSLAEGRVVILRMSWGDIRRLGTEFFGQLRVTNMASGHWDDEDWVQPEARIPLRVLVNVLCLPQSWQIVERPLIPTVWMDHWSRGGDLCLFMTSESFPVVPEGTIPPSIRLHFSVQFTEEGTSILYDGLDMSDVEAYANKGGIRI